MRRRPACWRRAGRREVERAKAQALNVYFATAPLMHGASQWAVMGRSFLGGKTVLCAKFDANEVWRVTSEEKVEALFITGDAMGRPLAEALDAAGDLDLSSLFLVTSTAAVFSPTVKDQFFERFPNLIIVDGVGASEVGGVFHCFSGDAWLAKNALGLGFYLSFSGILTFQNATILREIAKTVPLDRLLIETDCPYLTPAPHRGKRNEPAFVSFVAKQLAAIHEPALSLEQIERTTTENAKRLFRMNLFDDVGGATFGDLKDSWLDFADNEVRVSPEQRAPVGLWLHDYVDGFQSSNLLVRDNDFEGPIGIQITATLGEDGSCLLDDNDVERVTGIGIFLGPGAQGCRVRGTPSDRVVDEGTGNVIGRRQR